MPASSLRATDAHSDCGPIFAQPLCPTITQLLVAEHGVQGKSPRMTNLQCRKYSTAQVVGETASARGPVARQLISLAVRTLSPLPVGGPASRICPHDIFFVYVCVLVPYRLLYDCTSIGQSKDAQSPRECRQGSPKLARLSPQSLTKPTTLLRPQAPSWCPRASQQGQPFSAGTAASSVKLRPAPPAGEVSLGNARAGNT